MNFLRKNNFLEDFNFFLLVNTTELLFDWRAFWKSFLYPKVASQKAIFNNLLERVFVKMI